MIEVTHLTKRYGNHTAVSDLSFTIGKGQIYGFLGPNGAGKSTTMNIMTGCLAATSGDVKIGGYDIFEAPRQAKKLIGYLPEQPPLYLDRTPREYLTFVAQAKRIPSSEQKLQIDHALAVTQTVDVADRLIKNLSKGYKQRVGIAQAILGDPQAIILDEPTVGLDPRQIIEIRDLIQTLGEDHTVILSSHILSEVQAVCQTILIISKGKLVACDTPQNLERLFMGTASVDLTAEATEEEVREILSSLPYITELDIHECGEGRCSTHIGTEREADDSICRDIFFAFSHAEKAILQMSLAKASLEDVFIELTAGNNPAEADTETVTENVQYDETGETELSQDVPDEEKPETEPEPETEESEVEEA